jgi:putative oxidoreductase
MVLLMKKLYQLLIAAGSSLQSAFLLLMRLYWGWQLAQSGWGKLHNIGKVTEFFTSLNLPAPGPMAHFIATLELVGGILLFLGLTARLIAVPLTINLIMAYIIADREALFSFLSDPDKFTAAAPYNFLIVSLLVLIFGPGRFSIDGLLQLDRNPS